MKGNDVYKRAVPFKDKDMDRLTHPRTSSSGEKLLSQEAFTNSTRGKKAALGSQGLRLRLCGSFSAV